MNEPLVRVTQSGAVRTLTAEPAGGAQQLHLAAACRAAWPRWTRPRPTASVRCVVLDRRRPRLLRRAGPGRPDGRARPHARRRAQGPGPRDRVALHAAGAAHALDAGAGDRRGQRRRGRRGRQPGARTATWWWPAARPASSRPSPRSAWCPTPAAPGCCRGWSAARARWAWRCWATSCRRPRRRSIGLIWKCVEDDDAAAVTVEGLAQRLAAMPVERAGGDATGARRRPAAGRCAAALGARGRAAARARRRARLPRRRGGLPRQARCRSSPTAETQAASMSDTHAQQTAERVRDAHVRQRPRRRKALGMRDRSTSRPAAPTLDDDRARGHAQRPRHLPRRLHRDAGRLGLRLSPATRTTS